MAAYDMNYINRFAPSSTSQSATTKSVNIKPIDVSASKGLLPTTGAGYTSNNNYLNNLMQTPTTTLTQQEAFNAGMGPVRNGATINTGSGVYNISNAATPTTSSTGSTSGYTSYGGGGSYESQADIMSRLAAEEAARQAAEQARLAAEEAARQQALIDMMLQQQLDAENRMREEMVVANASIDQNANSAINQMDTDRIAQQRQAYVNREKSLASLPQASLAVGGGGMSETSLMGIDSGYQNTINNLVDTFSRNKTDILNSATNQKASNEASLASQVIDFNNQANQNYLQLLSTPTTSPTTVANVTSKLTTPTSTALARLKALGLTDEQAQAYLDGAML